MLNLNHKILLINWQTLIAHKLFFRQEESGRVGVPLMGNFFVNVLLKIIMYRVFQFLRQKTGIKKNSVILRES